MGKKTSLETENWSSAEMSGGDFGDEIFQFLGSFEEVLPEGAHPEGEAVENIKKEKPKKKKNEKKPEKSLENEDENVKMTKEEAIAAKKKRRNEQMKKNKLLKKERIAKRKAKEGADQPKIGEKRKADNEEEPEKKKKKKNDGEAVAEKKEKKQKPPKKCDLTAWQEFHVLPQQILDALGDLGFAEPTPIQAAVVPPAVRDRQDILGAAETGSGKTLAFGIPMVCRLLEKREDQEEEEGDGEKEKTKGPKALIIAPTRELVIQIMKHVTALIKHTELKAISIVGGLAQVKQDRIITQKNPDIVVATPGRLWAMMQEAEEGTYWSNFKQLACLVVDETDRMVEEGYFDELTHILNKVHEESNREKLQTLVFSATLTFAKAQNVAEEEKKKNRILTSQQKIQRLVKLTGLREGKHKVIDLTRDMGTAGCLVEARINCSNLLEKDTALVYLLSRYPGRTIVFVNSIDAARRLHGILTNVGIDPMILHAKMMQRQRLKNLEKFSEAKNAVLLATDVAARGLDIKGIDHVIHYQVPQKVEIYIHRSGRTARAAQKGLTVLLVDAQSRQLYQKLCRGLNRDKDLNIFPIDSEAMLTAIKTRVKLASEIDALKFRCKKIKVSESWFAKAAREADLDYDDARSREMDGLNEDVDRMMKQSWKLTSQLKDELATPLPRADGTDTMKTKYITPDIVARIENTGDNAIDMLNKKLEETKEWKKKSRKAQKKDEITKESRVLKAKEKTRKRMEERKKKATTRKDLTIEEN